MTLTAFPGQPLMPIGVGFSIIQATPANGAIIIDAANEAAIFIGYVVTSDGASHTIDTSGSSSLTWRTGNVTFSNAGSTLKVGLATVDTTTGPPGRAVNVADVVTFDVSASFIGGGGTPTSTAWQTSVPDSGSKTIANGDLVAFVVQMTALGGSDLVQVTAATGASTGLHFPAVTSFTGGVYSSANNSPNVVITFSDGALGYFYGSEVTVILTRTINSGTSPNEVGQLFNLPFPLKIYGIYGWINIASAAANMDVVLYSSPISGSPVPEKTISVDANAVGSTAGRKFWFLFPSPYTYVTNSDIAVVFKPATANNSTVYFKTLSSASHRIVDPYGTSGYGITRSGGSGTFANANSGLDNYYIGLLAGAFNN